MQADQRLAACVRTYQPIAPELADWLEKNVPESLTVFCLPQAHRVKMRTTNLLENLNKQVKRRTRVATLFPSEASCLRLVSAVLMELSEEWETGKVYLSMTVKND